MDRWTEGSAEFEKQLYDDLAKMLATRYVARDYTFEFCDWVVNSLWGLMIAREARAFSDRLCEVYQAFDDGEWNHFGKSQDPVADYTDPAIAEIVSKLEK